MSNPFAGQWTYRSFLNNPALTDGDPKKLEALLFAEGVWTVEDTANETFIGELSFGANAVMDLKGVITHGHGRPDHVHLRAAGVPGPRHKTTSTIMTDR
jgi:hypothetical protein